ncbi:hypothetical protein JCM16418A_17620 [Paenibacillus pini]
MNTMWRSKLALLLAIMMILAVGCSNKGSDNMENTTSNEIIKNPFEENTPNTMVLGNISHGFTNPQLDEKGIILPLQYNGSELKVDYSVKASGKAKNVGFLVFVDGKPQPYKFNSSEAPYEYMHIFELEGDDQDTPLSFIFTPVTGKKGDNLHVSIASVYNPGFIPDMKATTSFGGYQTTLESGRSLIFNKNAEALNVSSIPHQEILSNVRISTEPITQELLDKHSVMEKVDMATLDKKVYSDLYVDGSLRQDNLQIKKSGTLHLSFKLFGHPGIRYRSTIYINHSALSTKNAVSFETKLTKGNIAIIEADIDLEKLENFNTLYIVSIPVNANDFPDDVIILDKTPSLLLYK